MTAPRRPITILMADDDADDRQMTKEAFAEEDILRTYDLSAASYITKPVTFAALIEVVRTLGKYWLEIVKLPGEDEGGLDG
jgi:DNA-binding response OmpR family regulator